MRDNLSTSENREVTGCGSSLELSSLGLGLLDYREITGIIANAGPISTVVVGLGPESRCNVTVLQAISLLFENREIKNRFRELQPLRM